MLILTRRIGETVIIGGNVEVCVIAVNGTQVRLGIKAPKDVSVHREEIQKRIIDETIAQQTLNNSVPGGTETGRISSAVMHRSNVPKQVDLEK